MGFPFLIALAAIRRVRLNTPVLFASYICVAVGAYFLGSIPTGYLVAKARGIDIRSVGSGNIGATNVFRILGKPAGFFVLLVDALKGFLAGTILVRAGLWIAGAVQEGPLHENLSIVGAVAAILGHNYTCWLRFKGGKGIATSAGALLALMPFGLLISLLTWLIVFVSSKYVSLASIASAFILPFGVWATHGSNKMIGIAIFLGVLAIYKHKANVQRLLNGTEHRVGTKKSATAPQSTAS